MQIHYKPKTDILSKYIQLFAVTRFEEGTDFSGHRAKALPYGAVNLIFCFNFQFRYSNDKQEFTVGSHFKGPSLHYYHVEHYGRINLLLVSFKPYGLFPFFNGSIDQLYGNIVDIAKADQRLAGIEQLFLSLSNDEERIAVLEERLLQLFIPKRSEEVTISAIHIHRLHRGLLVELWEQINIFGALQQLGVIPKQG